MVGLEDDEQEILYERQQIQRQQEGEQYPTPAGGPQRPVLILAMTPALRRRLKETREPNALPYSQE